MMPVCIVCVKNVLKIVYLVMKMVVLIAKKGIQFNRMEHAQVPICLNFFSVAGNRNFHVYLKCRITPESIV